MLFHISIAFTSALGSIRSAGVYCDDSKAPTKHWKLVVATGTTLRLIEATTPDQKKILIATKYIERYLYDEEPLLKKYQVAKYRGNEGDFDRVLRHHPMRGGQYSPTFNNCQHFVAYFLMLLHALANGDGQKSFKGNALYRRIIDDVLFMDETFVWNQPNLYVGMTRLWTPTLLWPAAAAAETAAGATVTTVIPATGIMGWLGAAPTVTTVAAPYAAAAATAATALSLGMVAGAGGMAAFYYQWHSWKKRTKMKVPLVSGFPSGDKPSLSASELF